jgi:hypothetical protein
MSSTISEAQKRAKSKIEDSWKSVAQNYTAAWMEPIEAVETAFPHISSKVADIRRTISPTLPMIIYQTRNSPPENMSVAVPYESGGDPYKCRLVATNQLTDAETQLLADFAQAVWFLIDSRMLPSPRDGKAFEKKLVEWTDATLIAI